MSQEPLGERFGALPMHEMPASGNVNLKWPRCDGTGIRPVTATTSDLLNDVLVVEHPGGTLIVRGLDDWIMEPRKDHWPDPGWLTQETSSRGPVTSTGTVIRAFSEFGRYRRELSVITERRIQARPVREGRADGVELLWVRVPRRGRSSPCSCRNPCGAYRIGGPHRRSIGPAPRRAAGRSSACDAWPWPWTAPMTLISLTLGTREPMPGRSIGWLGVSCRLTAN